MDLSSEEEIPVFVTQNKFSNSLSVESEYDTDNVISDILGLETLSDTTYMPVCSDISDADDELLILTAEEMEKGSDYSTQARNNDETSTTSQNSQLTSASKGRFHKPKSDQDITRLQSKQ